MSKRRRCGYSLLEMLVVIATASLILGTVSTILFSTLRTASDAGEVVGRSRSLAQFEIQFRRDIGSGIQAEINDGALVIERSDQSTVRYVQANTSIERYAVAADGQPLSREIYRIDLPLSAQWVVSPKQPTFVSMKVVPPPDALRTTPALRALRIVAELGRISRLSAPLRSEVAP